MTSLIFPSKNVEASGTLVEASRFRVEFLIAISLNQSTFQKLLHTTAAPFLVQMTNIQNLYHEILRFLCRKIGRLSDKKLTKFKNLLQKSFSVCVTPT